VKLQNLTMRDLTFCKRSWFNFKFSGTLHGADL